MTVLPVVLGQFRPGSDEWLSARRRRLGGSEIAAVLGLSPYDSRFSLWHRKQGFAGPQPENPEMVVGRYVEASIADWWADQHPDLELVKVGAFVHPERPWQLASPDRLVYRDGELVAIWEGKFSPYGDGWGTEDTDEIPLHYLCQTRWYSNVFGGLPVEVGALVGGHFASFRVEQHESDVATMLGAGQEFIDSLEANERPPIDDHDQTYQVIRQSHPLIDVGEDHELDPTLALAYLETKDALTTVEKAHKTRRAEVLDALGEANYGIYLDTRIVRRQANGDGTPFLASTRKDPRNTQVATITERRTA